MIRSCREKKIEGTLKFGRVIAIFLSEKNFLKFGTKIFELKKAIAHSIFKIFMSTFWKTPTFL